MMPPSAPFDSLNSERPHAQNAYSRQWILFAAVAACLTGLLTWYALSEYRRIEQETLRYMETTAQLTAGTIGRHTVARLGGDEFVVLLETLHETPDQARKIVKSIAEKIRVALCAPYALPTATGILDWACSSSIGVTLFQGNSIAAEELLKRADQAMYAAKKAGRNQIVFAV